MNILVLGVSGFIGQHLYHALVQDGHRLSGSSRKRVPGINWYAFSFQQSKEKWQTQLHNIDLVINAVGIYQQSEQHRFSEIHDIGPKVLFDACKKKKIMVLQISAIGAEQANPVTEFLKSKRAADQYLLAQESPNVVLYPGIVLGEQGKTTRQLSLLARFYCIPLVFGQKKELPLISIHQLTDYIKELVKHWPAANKEMILIAKPETVKQLFNNLRNWMGLGNGCFFVIPKRVMDLGFYVFPELSIGVFNKQSMAMMSDFSNKKSLKDSKIVPVANETASESLLKHKATNRLKKDVKLKTLFYINLLVMSIIWIASGLSSLINMEQSRELISLIGINDESGDIIISIAALGNIILGLLLWVGLRHSRLMRWVIYTQISIMITYSIILTMTIPIFWLHPFAPIVKNLAIFAAITCQFEQQSKSIS